MFGSAALEVALGIVFIFLLLSLVVTAANELLSALFKSRGNTLWRGICNLLPTGDPAATTEILRKDFAQAVYDHPLVDGLSQGNRPSYIPSRTFTLALIDVIAGDANGKLVVANIQARIDELPLALRQPLNVLLSESDGDLEHFKMNVEVWFNNAMDRVGGWYKRRVQYWLFAIACVVTLVLNVDTIVLINRLATDPVLRAAVATEATAASAAGTAVASRPGTPARPGTSAASASTANDVAAREAELAASVARVSALNLPLGWSEAESPFTAEPLGPNAGGSVGWFFSRVGKAISRHLFGWALTAFAISLGAPFWFDILNRVVNIRSAGKAPEEKPKKPKKPAQLGSAA